MDNYLIAVRRDKAEILGGAHAMAADRYSRRYKWLGIPAAIISTIVGATALAGFIDFGPDHHTAKLALDILLFVLAVTVAVLTTVQTFLDYSAKSQKHADAAARLFALGRKWELRFDTLPGLADVQPLEDELNEIIQQAPRVSIKQQLQSVEKHQKLNRPIPPNPLGAPGRGFTVTPEEPEEYLPESAGEN
jgi:hypothetical protein